METSKSSVHLTYIWSHENTTWITEANVLFVDNPVGCGYSYVVDAAALTTNISEITEDLIVFFKAFLLKFPVFKKIPLFIAGESYGGKWLLPLTRYLPMDPIYFSSLLDEKDLRTVQQLSQECVTAANKGDYATAMHLADQGNALIGRVTDNVDVYYVLRHNLPSAYKNPSRLFHDQLFAQYLTRSHSDPLFNLMNGPIRRSLV
ncbi:Retinoid-inducible serine carboxypeptidase [Desmophyllum pertusum]|uniref:Carboxypeptidase n=1 Tax=Desmophyllum pertusum TaxID=174260 RepID=A0A9W9Z934_9CNID|nr:Retinoid-inducible serine carboxypeptidase [Desmophyllum pertusum]